jgi:hypothetical protein
MRTEIAGPGYTGRTQRTLTFTGRLLDFLHIDGTLLAGVLAVSAVSLIVLFSAGMTSGALRQAARADRLGVLLLGRRFRPGCVRPRRPLRTGVLLLVAVALVGDVAMARSAGSTWVWSASSPRRS